MDIVPAGPDAQVDIEPLVEQWVDLASGQRGHGSHLAAEENRTRIREAMLRHAVGDDLLAARDGEDILGFVMFTRESPTFEQDVERGIVENLYVRPESRGEGVGTALLAAAEQALRERGVDVVALEVMAENADARRFYEELGYDDLRVELEKSLSSDTH